MAAKQATGVWPAFKAFVNSPTGPRTTHFWGPVANWGFVLAVRANECGFKKSSLAVLAQSGLEEAAQEQAVNNMRNMLGQGLADSQKTPDVISPNMTGGVKR
jgi:hypothetical protein